MDRRDNERTARHLFSRNSSKGDMGKFAMDFKIGSRLEAFLPRDTTHLEVGRVPSLTGNGRGWEDGNSTGVLCQS